MERNTTNGFMSVFLLEFGDELFNMRWFIFAALVIIFADLHFGIEASRVRGEKIRMSRAWRRTLNKFVDYTAWLMIAVFFGKAFGKPFGIDILPALILLVIFGIEINSCFGNYFEARGKRYSFDIFKIFRKKTDIVFPEKEYNDKEKHEKNKNIDR